MGRDSRYPFPRAWLPRWEENSLAKEELRRHFRGARVILLERERVFDGTCLRGDPCDRGAQLHLSTLTGWIR